MASATNKNASNSLTVTQVALLGAVAASFTLGCVSSSSPSHGSGGATAGGAAAGGATGTPTGGATGTGGTTTTAPPTACTTDAGVVTGNACAPNPPIFALDSNCTIGLWSGDGISSGYFYQPWCNSSTTACTLTMTCAANSMHITGSYLGTSNAAPMDGNGGWGGIYK